MAHMLEHKIGQVRRRARRLLVLHAVSWTLVTVLAVVLLVALADYLIRFEDRGLRLMASLAIVAALAGAVYRFLWSGLGGLRLGDVQIAQRIERRFPSLGDRLESAIQFLKQPDLELGAGSAALRRAVIIDTESQVAELDVDQVIQPAPARRAMTSAGALALVAAVLVAISPASAKIAIARLARPFGDDAWPRYYHLEFKSPPARIAAGQNFEVELLHDSQHRLPEFVEIQYRYQTGPGDYEVEPESMRWLNGALVARKDNVQRPFEYRATGGDDDTMPWRRLEVLEAPRIAQLGVTLHPPQYTGLPVEESDKAIHALKGTRVALQGTVTKKIAKATLRHEDGGEISLEVAPDGYAIALRPDAEQPWTIEQTGQYWIELVDEAGLTGGADERWDVRSIADLEPTVTIEKPATNSYVTPQGELELAVAVKDDLAIRNVSLHFGRSDRQDVPDFVVPLHQGEPEGPRYAESGLLLGGKLGESRVVAHTWRLAELELKPGTQVTFWATASDYVPQEGKSTPRTITIITPAELEERLAQRQTLVVGELQRVLKLQQDARSQTRSLDIQVNEVAEFSKQEIDQAQSAELNQRQVDRTLTSPTEGIPAQIHEFLNELRANHVDSPGAMRQMTTILEEIERLEREHLGEVETELTGFIKAAQATLAEAKPTEASQERPNAKPDDAMRERLASAGEHQDAVINSLESLVDELGRWDNFRRFSREVAELERQQEEIAKATKELAPQTLGREFKELAEQQQADLKKLSSQQSELSRRLEKTQQQMGEMGRSLEENDPIAAATINDGLHHAREQAISGKMRESSAALDKNQLGQSAGLQEKVASELKELQSILSNRKEQELSRLVKQLRDSESELAALREQQAGLRKKIKEAEQIADPAERKRELERLSREQKKLAEEAQRLARKLQRLQADKAGGKTAGASNKMSQAGEQSESGDGQAAGEQAENAERDLEEAEQQLAQRRKQAEADLAREQLARMEDSLKGLHERQQKLIQETQRLEQLRAAEGRLSRAQLATLGDLSRLQQALGGETSQLAEKLELTEVIHLALSGAADRMQRAAELLELRDTGLPAQSAQEAARQRLAQLLAAFEKKQQPQKPGGKQGGGGGGSGGGEGERPDGEFVLAQLKLLKLLQEDLNQRYQEAASDNDASSRDVRRELVEIAAEQGKLAELTLKLSEPPADAPEDTPDKLPDVRESEPPLEGLPELEMPDLEAPLDEGTPEVPPPDAGPDAKSEEKP